MAILGVYLNLEDFQKQTGGSAAAYNRWLALRQQALIEEEDTILTLLLAELCS